MRYYAKVAKDKPKGDKLSVPNQIPIGFVIKYTPTKPSKTAIQRIFPTFYQLKKEQKVLQI